MFRRLVMPLAIVLMVVLIGLTGCTGGRAAQSGPEVGKAAPAFELKTPEGKAVSLASLRGKPVFVNFWATWCPPCRAEMPDMQDMYVKYSQQVHFLTINSREASATVTSFMQSNGFTFPVVLDSNGAVGTQYRVNGIPTTLMVDAKGIIRERHVGMLTAAQMEKMIRSVLP